MRDPLELPPDLPRPTDDGACSHLSGMRLPSIALSATTGRPIDLSTEPGRVAVFAYPRTGRPDEPPIVPEWDRIPGARGCTPQTCGFRDLADEFARRRCRVFGLSTQSTGYQQELVERLRLPFPVLSDSERKLTAALRLPTHLIGGQTLLKRLAWVAADGVIERVFYPVFPPDRNAQEVLGWLSTNPVAV
jgi:peroxiredoxin (alkyl hydroperoxide reductase subunit C)